jgi:hypothetical protein
MKDYYVLPERPFATASCAVELGQGHVCGETRKDNYRVWLVGFRRFIAFIAISPPLSANTWRLGERRSEDRISLDAHPLVELFFVWPPVSSI